MTALRKYLWEAVRSSPRVISPRKHSNNADVSNCMVAVLVVPCWDILVVVECSSRVSRSSLKQVPDLLVASSVVGWSGGGEKGELSF